MEMTGDYVTTNNKITVELERKNWMKVELCYHKYRDLYERERFVYFIFLIMTKPLNMFKEIIHIFMQGKKGHVCGCVCVPFHAYRFLAG